MTIGDKLRFVASVPYGIFALLWIAGYTPDLSGYFALFASVLMIASWFLNWALGTRRRIAEERERARSEQTSTDPCEQPCP